MISLDFLTKTTPLLPMNVKKTFSVAARYAATIVELITLLVFALPFGFVIGVLIASYINH